MKKVFVTVEYVAEYDDDITKDDIDIHDIIRDPNAIKDIALHIGKSHPVKNYSHLWHDIIRVTNLRG